LGEAITVELSKGLRTKSGEIVPYLKFSFSITNTDRDTQLKYLRKHFEQEILERFNNDLDRKKSLFSVNRDQGLNDSLPDDFPAISLNLINNPEIGYLFMGLYRFGGPNYGPTYLAIIDDYGVPIFYRKFTRMATNLKVLPSGLLTFFHDKGSVPPGGNNYHYIMNPLYTVIDSFCTTNGYITDLHEFRIFPDNHVFLQSYDPQIVRMDTIVPGGNPNAVVIGLIIQEFDASKNLIFQWRSWDHYEITDADSFVSLTDSIIDYVHGNSIEVDYDNNLLISARSMNEITKINRQTGDIIWRWGGENNQFIFINDNRGFSRQHHNRRTDNGNFTLFDNGNFLMPRFSSALEYQLDEQTMTATLVWSYRDSSIYGPFMGSTLRLPGGNTLIGWGGSFGGNPAITEVRSDGTRELELTFEHPYISYRVKRYLWETDIFYTDPDTMFFNMPPLGADTAYLDIQNPTNEDIIITTASTRTPFFLVIDSLPLLIPANSTVQISIEYNPSENGLIDDVLTIRADKATEGYGRQIYLFGENISAVRDRKNFPGNFDLRQNFPNPFNPSTAISYELPKSSEVSLAVYNLLGQKVRTLVNGKVRAGRHRVEWNSRNDRGESVASGIYIYRFEAGDYQETMKMILLK
jgi:hypothetical protein